MSNVTSTPVYTSSKEATGHIVVFDVCIQDFRTSRAAVRLPEFCELYDESFISEIPIETMFDLEQGGIFVPRQGIVSDGFHVAAQVFARHVSDPLNPRIGLRASKTSDGVALIGHLTKDTDLQTLCEELAAAIYENVAVATYQHTWDLSHMTYREHRDWQDYQLLGY